MDRYFLLDKLPEAILIASDHRSVALKSVLIRLAGIIKYITASRCLASTDVAFTLALASMIYLDGSCK